MFYVFMCGIYYIITYSTIQSPVSPYNRPDNENHSVPRRKSDLLVCIFSCYNKSKTATVDTNVQIKTYTWIGYCHLGRKMLVIVIVSYHSHHTNRVKSTCRPETSCSDYCQPDGWDSIPYCVIYSEINFWMILVLYDIP